MKKLVVALILILCACNPPTADSPPTSTPTAQPEDWVEFHFDDVTMRMHQLPGWDIYVKTDNRLTMAEGDDPFRDEGGLKGMLLNLWVPTATQSTVKYDLSVHSISQVLNLVLRATSQDSVSVHSPIPFDWDGHDAAYYTLTNDKGNITLVLALKVAEHHFVAVNISAPHGHGQRIRELLPTMFNQLFINDVELSNAALDHLPNPLVFPKFHAASPTTAANATETESDNP